MFFFFVGGVGQQVRQVVKSGAGGCIRCGSRADLVEYDNVLKVFFVPLWKWPGKQPLMYCHNCNLFFPPNITHSLPPPSVVLDSELRCRFCDRVVEPHFNFCPFCGSSL
ncbi:zf-ribbon_3 domain-containing protein [Cephalotus follicularis]|uniref:Zf-ribbon_3 domain-containing protein n=1 Tax=Cephalotus follicularis TaxID=3775 RepID=A0A1Q3BVF9_CEPFO|nr:zf-ribbon_3 domain-containing protein [Cephalotus follicularis]